MRTQAKPRMNLHGPRPLALLGVAIAVVAVGIAIPGVARGEVIAAHVVTPHQVEPHVASPAPATHPSAETAAPDSPSAIAPQASDDSAAAVPTADGPSTAPAPTATNPTAEPPDQDPEEGCGITYSCAACGITYSCAGEPLPPLTPLDQLAGPIMCPMFRTVDDVFRDFVFWSGVAAAAGKVNQPPAVQDRLKKKAAGFFAELFTARPDTWCFTTRIR